MSDANDARISSLLQEGLELYGTGDVSRAFLLWNEVLELDPGNEEALDYIRDADRRSKPRGGDAGLGRSSLVDEARRILRAEGPESALELLLSARERGHLESEAMIELLRASLFQSYQSELGDPSRVPILVSADESELRSRNLPPCAGFLLSMIDGTTPLGDLVSVCGMDRFEAMRCLHQLSQAGILEWTG